MSTNHSNIDELKQLLSNASEPKRLWRFSAKNKVRGLYTADVDADGQIEVIVGTDDNTVYLLNARDGKPRWRFQTDGWVPTVYAASVREKTEAEIIAGSDDGYVYVLDVNGDEIWRFGTTMRMRSVYAADVDQDGMVEVLSASFDKHLYVFDVAGRLKRSYDTGELIFKLRARDIDGDGRVEIVAATDSGQIPIYRYESERPRFVSCSERVFALELMDVDGDGSVEIIAGSFDNNLYAWNGQTLEEKWRVDLGARIYALLVTDIDHDGASEILVATQDGSIQVLDDQGHPKWRFALEHWAFDIWVGDIDGDSHLELLTCSEIEDCVQAYRLPDIRDLGDQIQQVYGKIEEAPSLDWNLSREQWELLSLVMPDLDLPERATRPGVCDRQLKSSDVRALFESGKYKEALRCGLELSGHRLDFAWDHDLKAELRHLAIYHDAPLPHTPLILCAPDHRYFLAIDNAGNEIFSSDVPFASRRIFAVDLFPDRKTIIVGLNSGLYTFEYPQKIGVFFPSPDWIQDMDIGHIDDDEHLDILLASFDGRVYVWDSRMALRWFYPRKNKEEPVRAVCALDTTWQTKARVVVGSSDGAVEAIDSSGTECIWRYDCQDRVYVIRAADFNTEGADPSRCLIFVGSDDGKVHALDVNGILRWQYYTGDAIKWIEVFDIDEDGLLEILVSAGDGSFYILDQEGDLKIESQLGDWVQGLQVADIDGDDRLEMCFGLRNRKKLFVYRFLQQEHIENFLSECLQTWQSQDDSENVVETLRADTDDLLRAYGARIWLESLQFDKNQVQSILQDRSENVRLELALALPRLIKGEPDPALDWLERLAHDSSWRVRRQLAANLPSFYEANREAAERCIDLLQGDDHPRVLRKLVRSLVKILHVGDWPYEKLLTMAQWPEFDEWVRHEIVRGLASFINDHPEQAPELLKLTSFQTVMATVLELLDRNKVAFHILVLDVDIQPDRFNESVTKLAQYMAKRLNQGIDDEALRISPPESVQTRGNVHAVVFQNVKSLFEEEDLPDDVTLPVLFQRHKTLNTRDIRSLLGKDSIGIFVSFEETIPRQTLDLLRSLSFNYELVPLTYLEFLDLATAQHPRDALRDVLRKSVIEMDRWAVSFIGRKTELETIQTHLLAWRKRRIMFIHGDGGIGKTRLLHESDRYFAAVKIDIPLMMLSIMDFDDDQYKVARNVLVSIARQLDPDLFSPYLEAVRQMHLMEEGVAEGEVTTSARRDPFAVDRHFIDCFNDVSRDQRVVLRLDTTDALSDDMPITYLLGIFSRLNNVLVLVAGRNTDDLYQKYGKAIGEDAILLPLEPFTLSASRAYLVEKQNILKVALAPEWMDKLCIFAGGLPVLIDLAIEWAQSHRSLPWMDDLSLSDVEELQKQARSDTEAQRELGELQEKFKKGAVMPIADLRDNLDHLKLVLSKVHPLDLEGVMEMLNLSQKDARRLIAKAKQSVAIKTLPDGRIKLHDEVERLVNRYVWPQFDRDGGREQRDSRRAIAYLTRKSESLLNEIRQLRQHEFELMKAHDPSQILEVFGERFEKECTFEVLRIERLRRQLAIDVSKGYELFHLDYCLPEASWPYRQGLLDQIAPYADWDSPKRDIQGNVLTEPQQLTIQHTLADHATRAGLYNKAAELYQRLLEKVLPDSEEYVEILIGQANRLARAGKLQQALEVNKEALKSAEEIVSHKWLMRSTLALGWIYRLIGNLEEALKHYNDALRMAIEHDDKEQIALIYNNLAYVHALQNQERVALDEIKQAIRWWQEMARKREENRLGLGQCYNTAGEVYLELERPEEALAYFELSWTIFNEEEVKSTSQEVKTAEWKSRSRSGRGFAYWQLAVADLRKGYAEAAQRNLQDALGDLEWAAEHATDTDRPTILNRRGEVDFLLKNYQAAKDDWQKSVTEAQQVGDASADFRGVGNLARVAFYCSVEGFPTWQTFERWYKKDYQPRYRVRFELLVGLFFTYLGHLALKGEEVEDALRLYRLGLPILAQTGTYAPFNLIDQLDFIECEILPHISPYSVRQVGQGLKEKWVVEAHGMLALTYFREWSR